MKSMVLRATVFLLMVGVYVTHPRFLSAQPVDAAEDRATAFQAVQGPPTESVPGGVLFLAGYAVAWALVFGFVFRVARMSHRVALELDDLKQAVASGARLSPPTSAHVSETLEKPVR